MNGSGMEELIEKRLTQFIETDTNNMLAAHNNMKIYDAPLVGIASADDPYFQDFRQPHIVGTRFMPPEEWLAGAHSVISFFLPFTKEIRESNRPAGIPSEEWMSARIDGEKFNRSVRAYLVVLLEEMGAQAVAPCIDARFSVEHGISNWSERHVAFTAGLGTFGLHRGLITAKGTTGRFGSVVTTLPLATTERAYTRYDEYCPYLTSGKCGACIKRCPPLVINKNGKDNKACGEYIDNEILSVYSPRYGCAKCNTAVPCEHQIPSTASPLIRKAHS